MYNVFQELKVPNALTVIIKRAGNAYVEAIKQAGCIGFKDAEGAVGACLVVEVAARAFAPSENLVEPLMPRFEFLRLGPDSCSPLFHADRFEDIGDRKLYGVRFQHFGSFLHPPWRKSDFIWVRLDAAHHLLGLFEGTQQERREREEEIHNAILDAEGTSIESMTTNLDELVQPGDHLLLKKVEATPEGRRALRNLVECVVKLIRIPPWAQILLKRTREAAWNAYLKDPATIPEKVRAAAWGTIRQVLFIVALVGILVAFTAVGLVLGVVKVLSVWL